ncbi:MAG TPA: CPBP family intramembrane glutamic endopeptidase [Isosphaeraceae bacterium]|jgi:membrane protease YdiL (CAAX protease family)|nr:CPBP family intramembrane glutamic endopeptidase [Isosphaeraceae bacterium]
MPNPETPLPALVALLGLFMLGSLLAWSWAIGLRWRGQPLLPQAPPRQVPWGLGSVLTLILLYLALNASVPFLLHRWIMGRGPSLLAMAKASPEAFFIEQLLLLACINACVIVLTPQILNVTSAATRKDFGLGQDDQVGRNCVRGMVGWLMFTPGVYGMSILATQLWMPIKHPLEEMVRANPTPPVVILAVISAVILAPAVEELLFRGVLQGWLIRLWPEPKRGAAEPALLLPEEDFDGLWEQPGAMIAGPLPGIPRIPWRLPGRLERELSRAMPNLVTSMLFAAVHLPQWPAPVAIFALSMVLGVLYQRTGSIVGPIVLHALFNGMSTLMLFTSLP